MEIIHDLFRYTKKPIYIEKSESPNKGNLTSLGILLVIKYILAIIWILTINAWIKDNYDIERSEITEEQTLGQGLLMFFLTAVIIYPIVEELIFRYFLKGKKIVSFLIVGILLALGSYWILKGFIYPSLTVKRIILIAGTIFPIGILLFLYVRLSKLGLLQKYYSHIFPMIFYASATLFGLVHIMNYDWTGHYLIAIPFIVPQLISGLVYGFARMRYGLWASILLHIGSNGITFILDKVFGI